MTDDPNKRPKRPANQSDPAEDMSGLEAEETVRHKPGHASTPAPEKGNKPTKEDTEFLEYAATKSSNTPPQPPLPKSAKEDTEFLEYAATKSSNTPPPPPTHPPVAPTAPPKDATDFLEADGTMMLTKKSTGASHPPASEPKENTEFLERDVTRRPSAPHAAAPPENFPKESAQSLEAEGTMIFKKPAPDSPPTPPDVLEAEGTMFLSKPHASNPLTDATDIIDTPEFFEGDGTMIIKKPSGAAPQPPSAPANFESDATMFMAKPPSPPAEASVEGATEFLEADATRRPNAPTAPATPPPPPVAAKTPPSPSAPPPTPPAAKPSPSPKSLGEAEDFDADGTQIFSKLPSPPPQVSLDDGTDFLEAPKAAHPPASAAPPPAAFPPPKPPPAPTPPPKTPVAADSLEGATDFLEAEPTRHAAPPPPPKPQPTPPPAPTIAAKPSAPIPTPAPAPPKAAQKPSESLEGATDFLEADATRHNAAPPLASKPQPPPAPSPVKPQKFAGPTDISIKPPAPQPPVSSGGTAFLEAEATRHATPPPPVAKNQPPPPLESSLDSKTLDDSVTRPSPDSISQTPSEDTATVVRTDTETVAGTDTKTSLGSDTKTVVRTDTKTVVGSDTKTAPPDTKSGAAPLPRRPEDSKGIDEGYTKTHKADSSGDIDTSGSDFDLQSSDAEDTTITPRSARARTKTSILNKQTAGATSSTADQLVAFLTERATETPLKITDLHWRAGEKIGDANHTYHLIRPLGKGGFGEVWLALDAKDDMQVALKLVNLDDIGLDATRKEIQNNYKLEEFRSFIRIYSDMEYHGWLAISMEYVDGASFSQIMKTAALLCEKKEIPRPYFEPEEIRSHVKQLCTALDYLHNLTNRRGKRSPLIHCDIKPANLMVSRPGYGLKVADLGIARQAVSLSMSQSKADPNQGAMALAYGSPQQYDDLTPEPSDDTYAVGATIYHFLTGAPPPFNAEKLHKDPTLIQPSMTGQREKLWKTWKDKGHEFAKPEKVPENWERAVAACLAARREDRPESTLKVLELLGLPPSHSVAPGPAKAERADKPLTFEELLDGSAKEKRFAARYILRERLGKGGMGVVWRAEDRRFKNQMAALKFLKPDVAETILKTELMAKNLVHDHIVKTQDYLEEGDLLAIPMEYVKGDTLEQQLSTRKKDGRNFFEVDEIKDWLVQLCDALTYAHNYVPPQSKKKSAIIHRDIKPSNLMVGEDNALKILDFGLARKVDQSMAMDTNYNEGLTIAYASPQQADKQNPKVTDDIYSVGATLYHMLTGAVPAWSCKDLLAKRGNPPKQPSIADRRGELFADEPNQKVGKEVPPSWERTIASCLNFDPEVRPQSAWEILEMLGLKPRDLRSGSLVFNNQFKLDRVLDETPEAETWLAFDDKLKTTVKLVIYSRELSQKPEFAAKLELAIVRCKPLEGHPHIAPVFGVHYDPKRPLVGVAMEYIHAHSGEEKTRQLSDLRPRGSQFCDPVTIGKYLRQLCETLAFAHKNGVTHQDIQASNLLIDPEGSFVVSGFGLADCVREASGAEHRPPATPAEDIYALGVTVYQLLTDSQPFAAEKERSTTRRKALPRMQERREQKQASTGRGGSLAPIPKRWEIAVARCLEKEPAKRPSADELVKFLRPKPKWVYPVIIGAPILLIVMFCLFFMGGVVCTVSPSDAEIDIFTVDANKSNFVAHASNMMPKRLPHGTYRIVASAKGFKPSNQSEVRVQGWGLGNWNYRTFALEAQAGTLKVAVQPPGFHYTLYKGDEVEHEGNSADLTDGLVGLRALQGKGYTLRLSREFWDDINTNIAFDGSDTTLRLTYPFGTLTLPSVTPPNASLALDGKEIAITNRELAIYLPPGEHTLTAEVTNWPAQSATYEIHDGNQITAPAIKFDFSTVTIDCRTAGATIKAEDGQPQTINGKVTYQVKPETKQTYVLTKPDYEDYILDVAPLTYGHNTNFIITLAMVQKAPVVTNAPPVVIQPVPVRITTTPPNAVIELDGEKGVTQLKPGSHRIQIEARGFDSMSERITVTDKPFANTYSLVRSRGKMSITSTPSGVDYSVQGAEELTSGQRARRGKSGNDETLTDLPTGKYNVTFARVGFSTNTISVEVNKGVTAHANYTFPEGTLALLTGDCPPDAQIFVDNNPLVKNANGVNLLALPPGRTINVRATYPGLEDFTTNITVLDGRRLDCPIIFSAGYLVINSSPKQGAQVTLNDQIVGTTPYTNRFVPPGNVNIGLMLAPFQRYQGSVDVHARSASGKPQVETITMSYGESALSVSANIPETEIWIEGRQYPQNEPIKLSVGQTFNIIATNRILGVSLSTNALVEQKAKLIAFNFVFSTIEVDSQPANARLVLTDASGNHGLAPNTLNYIKPGTGTIKLEAEGWNTVTTNFTLGDQQSFKAAWPMSHTFTIGGDYPGVQVAESDGSNRGTDKITLSYGSHNLTAKYGLLSNYRFNVDVNESSARSPLRVPHIPYGTLTVATIPAGEAAVYEGSTLVGNAGTPIGLDPGPHSLLVKPAGKDNVATNITLADGVTTRIVLNYNAPVVASVPSPVVTGAYTNSIGMALIWIPGLPGGAPGFGKTEPGGWVAMYKVTQDNFMAITSANPSKYTTDGKLPVESMTSDEASDFCDKLTAKDQQKWLLPPSGWKYKLPSVDQWRFVLAAAGLPNDKVQLKEYAVFISSRQHMGTADVGTLRSSPQLPLYDLLGNAWELTSTPSASGFTVAGGAWDTDSGKLLGNLNGDFPVSLDKDVRRANTGFRVFLVPDK